MSAPSTDVPTPILPPKEDVQQQIQDLTTVSIDWLQNHWLQILIALGFGAIIFVALHGLRRLAYKLCARDPAGTGWPTVIGRAVTRTNNFFIVMAAAKLVSGYAGPPQVVATTINFFWTVAAVFLAAIWAREIILGAVEYRANREGHPSEGLISALGLIRLIVTFVLFAIALIVVLDNLGVNVTGLVVTKLDGSARGGVVVALAEAFGLPVHAVGVGEQAADLRPFAAIDYAKGLVGAA